MRTVVLLARRGIIEEIGYWEVSPLTYGRVGTWADEHDQALLAVAHSHLGRGATAMSGLDRRAARCVSRIHRTECVRTHGHRLAHAKFPQRQSE